MKDVYNGMTLEMMLIKPKKTVRWADDLEFVKTFVKLPKMKWNEEHTQLIYQHDSAWVETPTGVCVYVKSTSDVEPFQEVYDSTGSLTQRWIYGKPESENYPVMYPDAGIQQNMIVKKKDPELPLIASPEKKSLKRKRNRPNIGKPIRIPLEDSACSVCTPS